MCLLGLTWLVGALKKDGALRKSFFAELNLVFYAGASLPPENLVCPGRNVS